MPRFEDETIKFDVPRDWLDRTIVAYAAPLRPGQERTANLVMTRQELREDDTFDTFVDRHLDQLAERMHEFEVVESEDTTLGGCPAVSLKVYTSNSDGEFEQRLAMVHMPGRIVASFTLTAPEQDAVQLQPLFDHILSTIDVVTPTAGTEP